MSFRREEIPKGKYTFRVEMATWHAYLGQRGHTSIKCKRAVERETTQFLLSILLLTVKYQMLK
jgi:hypothetical protein